MRTLGCVIAVTVGMSALALGIHSAALEDGKAIFERRADTMKHMGRALFLGVGRVVKGTTPYSADAVTAAETVASIARTLNRDLFLRGSDVAESKIKPAIFDAGDHVDQLIAAVQAATVELVPAVKKGQKAAIVATYTATVKACNACHTEFRTEE
jgi:cytochrome c556